MVNLLTPHDVDASTFHVRRLTGGYDTDEVDMFLDDVHTTIQALIDWRPPRVPRKQQRRRYIQKGGTNALV